MSSEFHPWHSDVTRWNSPSNDGSTSSFHWLVYVYICMYLVWYLHNAATRGLRSIHHQTGGPGCRGAHHHPNQALRHSRKSTSLSEMKGVWYLWRSEAASQALRPLSLRYTEEEQFMELFLKVNWHIKQKASIEITSISIPSMVCSYILTRQAPCFGLNLLFQLNLAS